MNQAIKTKIAELEAYFKKDCCPKCKSTFFITERRPDGFSTCKLCSFSANSKEFIGNNSDNLNLKILSSLSEAVEALESVNDDMNHYYENKCLPTESEVLQVKQALASIEKKLGVTK